MKITDQATSLLARCLLLVQAIAFALAYWTGNTQAAVFNVTVNTDSGPGSLRQAVLDANANSGADQITFDADLSIIALTSGQINITETLTITGPAAGQTIDAGGNSRIFAVTVTGQPLILDNLTLTGGYTAADGVFPRTCAEGTGEGGGICTLDDIILTNSTVSSNRTEGFDTEGGGLFVFGDANLTNSTVSGNRTAGDDAGGGGLFVFGDANLTNSTVSGNRTAGLNAYGGGLLVIGNATLTNSTVSGNSTVGDGAEGGGLVVNGNATLTNSTVSGNRTMGDADGGGLVVSFGDANLTNSAVLGNSTVGDGADVGGLSVSFGNVTLTNSTVSGNSTAGDDAGGAGLGVLGGNVTLTNSTVSGNSTAGDDAKGGGLFVFDGNVMLTNSTITTNQSAAGAGGIEIAVGSGRTYTLTLIGTLLAANSGPEDNFNTWIIYGGSVTLNASNSLFGDNPAEINGINSNNVFTDIPGLAGLADNGCAVPAGALGSASCVQTHALLLGSPALDAGSNPLNLTTDQRGSGFPRVLGAAADIGAFESLASISAPVVMLDPLSVNFGSQRVGTTSGAEQVTLTNIGGLTLNISNIGTSGNFSQTNNCGTTLAAGSNCTIDVTFTPTGKSQRMGTLRVTSNAASSPNDVALNGIGITILLRPPVITSSIPTLSEWGMITLSSLLVLIAIGMIRLKDTPDRNSIEH